MLYIHSNDQTFLLPPAKVTKVVNTIGAGDVSFASFIHFYSQKMDPIKALQHAQIFVAKKIVYNGASMIFVNSEEVEIG